MAISFVNKSNGDSGDGSSMNIFVQKEEPKIKDGIWVQADREIKHIVTDENVFIEGEFNQEEEITKSLPLGSAGNTRGNVVFNKNNIYYLYPLSSNLTLTKYDINTDSLEDICKGGRSDNKIDFMTGCIFNNKLYFFYCYSFNHGGCDIFCIDLSLEQISITSVLHTSSTSEFATGSIDYEQVCLVKDNDIFILGESYKFDTLTNSFVKIENIPYGKVGTIIGDNIFMFNEKIIYKYNITEQSYDILNQESEYSITSGWYAVNNGTNIYLIGDKILKYNLLNNSYELIKENVPWSFEWSNSKNSCVRASIYNNKLYIEVDTKIYYLSLTDKQYQPNTLVISQGKYKTVGYEIKPFSNKLMKENLIYPFVDAWFYSDHLETDLPTYYGNGTEWVKIKN